jgi:YD repeat-containing protein
MEEYDGSTLMRKTVHYYDTLDTSTSYIVDRPWADAVFDGSGNQRALTHYFYDSANTAVNTVGVKGELTRVAKYYNLPIAPSAADVTLLGRDTTYTYDAFGNRLTETTYGGPGTRLIVSDMRYDGLNQQIEISQPRYAIQNTGFEAYTSPGSNATPLYNHTVTSYDVLGRVSTISPPDNKPTAHFYLVWNDNGTPRVAHNVVDANQHRTKYSTDALGRLVKVEEVSGNCGQFGQVTYSCASAPYTTHWAAYSATAYEYSALDQLIKVTAANGITNTMQYDSLGRKSNLLNPALPAMITPTM